LTLFTYIGGGWISQAIRATAHFRIADLLASGPKTSEQIAALSSPPLHAPSLFRLLRLLSSLGVFSMDENYVFSLNGLGGLLRSDVPNSVRSIALLTPHPQSANMWLNFEQSIITGEPKGLERVGASSYFEFLEKVPELHTLFASTMECHSNLHTPAIVDAFDFSGFPVIVDVGGSQGRLLSGILEKCPSVKKGIVLDLASIVESSQGADRIDGRLELLAGDMFASVVHGGDLYIMKTILHNWNDEKSLDILKNVSEAMKPGAVLLVIENKLSEGDVLEMGKLLDLQMLHSFGGKERTIKQFEQLLAKAGLHYEKTIPTKSAVWIVEAKKV